MGTTLTGTFISQTFDALIKVTDNDNLTSTAKRLTDGLGNDSPLFLSTTKLGVGVTPTTTFQVSGNSQLGGNLTVTGDLIVQGTTTTVDTDTLSVKDPLIIVGSDNTSSDAVDLGFYGVYDTSGSLDLYAGLFRDASDAKFHLFKDLQTEPTTTVNKSGTGYTKAGLVIGGLEATTGNFTGSITVSSSSAPVIQSTTNSTAENLLLIGTDTSAASAPDLVLYRNAGAPADNDTLGVVEFRGNNAANNGVKSYSGIFSRIIDGSEHKGALTFSVNGTNYTSAMAIHNTGTNEPKVIIGNTDPFAVPTHTLDVDGDASFSGDITVDGGDITLGGTGRIQGVDTVTASTDAANKAYVDAQITAQDLDIVGDSGTGSVDLDSQTFTIAGGTNVTTSVSGQTVTINASGDVDGSGTANDVVMWQDSNTLTDAPIAISGNNATFAGNISLLDSKELKLGTDADFKIYHNNTNAYIQNYSGDLIIENFNDDKDIIFKSDDGSGGTENYIQIDGSEGRTTINKPLRINDSVELQIGNSADLKIYHDGANSFVQDTGTGGLFLEGNGEVRIRKSATSEIMGKFIADGAVELYHDNSKKLETTSTGVNITGKLTVTDSGADLIDLTRSSVGTYRLAISGSDAFSIFDVGASADRLIIDSSGNTTFTGNISVTGTTFLDGDVTVGDTSSAFIGLARAGLNYIAATNASGQLVFRTGGTTAALTLNASQNATFAGDITLDNSGSGDRTLTISTTTGGDPTIVFNSDAANRSGLIRYQDNGTNIGRIEYVHNGDRLAFQAGSATGETLSIKNGAVGIGTTSPAKPLHVVGEVRFDNDLTLQPTRKIYLDGGNDTYITEVAANAIAFNTGGGERVRIDSSGNIFVKVSDARIGSDVGAVEYGTSTNNSTRFYTNNAERMRIASNGNVGISQTSPTSNINSGTFFKPDSSGRFLTLNGAANGSFIMLESSSTTDNDQIGGVYFTATGGQGDAHKQVAGIDAIVFAHGTTSLNGADLRFFTKPAGAGSTTPALILAHNDSATFAGQVEVSLASNQIKLSTGTAGDGYLNIGHFSNGTFIGTYGDDGGAADLIRFGTHSGDERMRIDSSGNVSIGTTSTDGKLTVAGSIQTCVFDLAANASVGLSVMGMAPNNFNAITLGSANSTNNSAVFRFKYNGAGSIDNYLGIGFYANDDILNVRATGKVGINQTSPGSELHIEGNGGDGTAMLKMNASAGSQTFNWISSVTYPNLAADKTIIKLFGKEQASNNQAYIGFKYAGDHSTSNQLTFGFYANDFLVNLLANGNLGISQTSPVGKIHTFSTSTNGATDYAGNNFGIIVSQDNGNNAGDEGNGIVFTQQYAADGVDAGQIRTGAIIGHKVSATGTFGGGLKFKVQPAGANPLATALTLSNNSSATFAGGINTEGNFINIGNGQSHSENYLQIGNSRTGNGFAYIDLIGDATYTDFGLRIIRGNTGANASSVIEHRGTGDFVIQATDAAALRLNTSNTERMRISAGGNIGIGETSPSKKLVLNENDNECVMIIKSSDTGTAGVYMGDQSDEIVGGIIYDNNNDLLQLRSSNNNTAVSIDSSERVGIGTTSPSQKLHIAGNSATSIISLQRTNANTTGSYGALQFTASDEHSVAAIDAVGDGDNEGGHLVFRTTSAASSNDPYSLSERMRITSSGNVGIGLTSPAAKLEIQDSTHTTMKIRSGNNDNILFAQAIQSNDARIGTDTNTPLSFYTNTSERVRITTSGNVGIGTTSPSQKLQVDGTILANSDVIAFSDKRLKENIKTLDGKKVYDMRGVSFTRKDTGKDSSGVIAQEIQKIAPELVTDNDGTLSVAYGNLTGYLIEAIKELKQEVEELKKQIK